MPKPKKHVFVCVQGRPQGHPMGSCEDKNCADLWYTFSDAFTAKSLWQQGLALTNTGCLGPCQYGPSVLVYPDGVMYTRVTPADVNAIIEEHLLGGQPVERLLAPPTVW